MQNKLTFGQSVERGDQRFRPTDNDGSLLFGHDPKTNFDRGKKAVDSNPWANGTQSSRYDAAVSGWEFKEKGIVRVEEGNRCAFRTTTSEVHDSFQREKALCASRLLSFGEEKDERGLPIAGKLKSRERPNWKTNLKLI